MSYSHKVENLLYGGPKKNVWVEKLKKIINGGTLVRDPRVNNYGKGKRVITLPLRI